MTTENRIFLAHASEDKPQVRRLYDQLKERGFSPWLDAVDLIPGQNWREEIPKAIREATICLACLSKRSVEKKSYVEREFRYALSAYADRPPGSIYLIPVRLDECEVPDLQIAKLDLNLRDLHWIDLFDDGGFEKLINALGRVAPPKRVFADFEVFRDIDAPWCPEMVMIPAGTFLMGSPAGEKGRLDREGPQHEVTISQAFALGRYPITFDEYDHFCDQTNREEPEDMGWGRRRRPVIRVSHKDAQAYCAWLSGVTNAAYRLPTEAEWEYACRAGTTTAYAFGDQITQEQANFIGGSSPRLGKTSEVGAYLANPWGLHDMHGNVWEWCADGYRKYEKASMTDPQGPADTMRVLRGGSWFILARNARSACRSADAPGVRAGSTGFRCARVQEPASQ